MPAPPTRLDIVIPNYNGQELLRACLMALRQQTCQEFRVIVVDDASTDGAVAMLARDFPEVTVIAQAKNGGFCIAVNTGLRAVTAEYVFVLNNDTKAEPECVAAIIEALDTHPEFSFGTAKLLFADRPDRINSAGLFYRVDGVSRDIGWNTPDDPADRTPREVFGVTNGASVFRRAVFDRIGYLDEQFWIYFEDADWSLRARLQGERALFIPGARIHHKGSATMGRAGYRQVYYGTRNMLYVLIKNFPGRLWLRYFPRILLAQVFQLVYFTRQGQGRAVFRGKRDALLALPRLWRQRREIQARATISAHDLERLLEHGWRSHRISEQ